MRRTLLVFLTLAVTLGPGALGAADLSDLRPQVSKAVRHDVSPPFRELALRPRKAAPVVPNREIVNRVPLDIAQRHHGNDPLPDPLANGPIIGATPAPLSSFEGQSDDDNAAVLGGRIVPPDTNADVGPSHIVQTINLIFAVYNKSGTKIFGPAAVNSLWDGFGGDCENFNNGDPTVLYDDAADRWVISQFAVSGPDGHQCVAVSTSGDPTGSYFRYDFVISPARFNDYPKMGVWSDGYYVTANEFTSSFQGVIAVAFERSRMLSGLSAQMVKFGPLTCATECYFSMQPGHYDGGTAPPAGAPNPFIQSWDDETWGTGAGPDGYRMFNFAVNWTTPSSSTFTALAQVNTAEFDANLCNFSRACIRQPAPGERLDPLGQFTMYRAMYRNFGAHQSLLINHTVDVGNNRAGVRWAELRNSGSGWSLHQSGTISPTSDSRWMGSLAMDKQGNIAIGYSVSSQNVRPSLRYVTRAAGDPLGTVGSEVTLHPGTGVQQSSSNRWGDYSSMSVDPADGCTFWFTNEYYANNGSFDFKTRIGSFKQPGCV